MDRPRASAAVLSRTTSFAPRPPPPTPKRDVQRRSSLLVFEIELRALLHEEPHEAVFSLGGRYVERGLPAPG